MAGSCSLMKTHLFYQFSLKPVLGGSARLFSFFGLIQWEKMPGVGKSRKRSFFFFLKILFSG